MTVPAWLRSALAITCLACLGLAQTETEEGRVEEIQRRKAAAGSADGQPTKGGKEEILGEDEKLTPEQRLARNITAGAASYCRFVGAVRPAKLMPGQSGTMLVTALLQGAAVLPAPAPLELVSQAQQGVVTLGGMTMRAAEPGKLASGYLGRPVYENYALLEIPVTMSADAKVGQKHSINVEFKFDIYDGTTAQAIGRFVDHAVAEVEVGLSPDPVVAGGSAGQAAAPSAVVAPAPIQGAATPVVDASKAGPAPLSGKALVPADTGAEAPAATVPTSAVAPSVEDAEGDLPIVPIAVGGALLLVVVILLARKK